MLIDDMFPVFSLIGGLPLSVLSLTAGNFACTVLYCIYMYLE